LPKRAPAKSTSANTAIFSAATAVSRVAGLVREIVANFYFGTGLAVSAFTFASQIPNLMSNLFAQAALSAAFVPIFAALLQEGRKREAFRLANSMFWLVAVALGVLTLLGMLLAGVILPLFSGPNFRGPLAGTLTQIMFPTVLLMGLTGVLTGILQSYDQFTIPALAPIAWNFVILALMIVLHHKYGVHGYAWAWVAGTVVQFLLVLWALHRIDFRLSIHFDWHDPRVQQVLILMLPVTIGLGIANLDALINSTLAVFVPHAYGNGPRAVQNAFLIYMLPQGVFSVAVATVLFPTLSRQAARRSPREMRATIGSGMRQINLMLIPAAAGMAALATPIVRIVFMRGAFDGLSLKLTSEALFWFAFSMPFAGINLLLTRSFYALQRPWLPAKYAAMNMIVDIIVSVALYRPLGIAGLVIGTALANIVMTWLLLRRLKIGFNGRLELGKTTMITIRILIASVLMAILARLVWWGLDTVVGQSTIGQIISVGGAVVVAGGFYAWAVIRMRIHEAHQIARMIRGRLGLTTG
jgi:putative peptidoglycan lipid II flippase